MGWHTDFTPTKATITLRPGAVVRTLAWCMVAFVGLQAHIALWQLAAEPVENSWIVGALLLLLLAGIGFAIASIALRSSVITFDGSPGLVIVRRLWGRQVRSEQRYRLGAHTDVALESNAGHRGVTCYHLMLRGEPPIVLVSGGRDITRLVDEVRAWLARVERRGGKKRRPRRRR